MDQVAAGVLEGIRSAGLGVPEHVSVVAHDVFLPQLEATAYLIRARSLSPAAAGKRPTAPAMPQYPGDHLGMYGHIATAPCRDQR